MSTDVCSPGKSLLSGRHTSTMTWAEYFRENEVQIARTDALTAAGATWRSLATAVNNGYLIRARRGHYALPGVNPHVLEAVRVGGRLGCISAAADLGVFAFDATLPHIHVDPTGSRLRAPHDRFQRLADHNRDGIELHWGKLLDLTDGTEFRVGLIDALVQAFRCQAPRFAVASLDNALRKELILPGVVPEIFAALPQELQYLSLLVDGRSDAGQETVLRFIVREAGYQFEFQVSIDGVGRVDMVVEGCLVVEADSRQFHDGWDKHVRDRTRDRNLGIQGYMSYRALHRDIMYNPEFVVAAIAGFLSASHHYRTFIV